MNASYGFDNLTTPDEILSDLAAPSHGITDQGWEAGTGTPLSIATKGDTDSFPTLRSNIDPDRRDLDLWYDGLVADLDLSAHSANQLPLANPSACTSSQILAPSEYFPIFGDAELPYDKRSLVEQITPDLTYCSTPTSVPPSLMSSNTEGLPSDDLTIDDQRWHAIRTRSRAADRSFLYGVLTTKIFCRPSCAARRANRKNVRFFVFTGAIEAAQKAEFRPCKRCIPDALGVRNTGVLGIVQVLRLIIAEMMDVSATQNNRRMKLDSLAKSAGLSTFHFHRLFKATTNTTPGDFIQACRSLALQDAHGKDNLKGSTGGITAAALVEEAPCWNLRTARKALGGVALAEYVNGAPLTNVRYSCVKSPYGTLCITFSVGKIGAELKVHGVLIGEDAEARSLQRFPAALVTTVHANSLQAHVKEIEGQTHDRDTQVATDMLPFLWRARVWLRLSKELAP